MHFIILPLNFIAVSFVTCYHKPLLETLFSSEQHYLWKPRGLGSVEYWTSRLLATDFFSCQSVVPLFYVFLAPKLSKVALPNFPTTTLPCLAKID